MMAQDRILPAKGGCGPHSSRQEGGRATDAADDSERMRARLDLALAIAARKSQRRRPEDTHRTRRSMWALLCWTYRTQILRAQAWSVGRWADVLFALDGAGDVGCSWHVDAVAVHAAVSMLPPWQRDVVWDSARVGMAPRTLGGDEKPIFKPEERQGRGHVGPIKRRYWHGCSPIDLKPMEIKRLSEADCQAEREIVVSQGGQRNRYRYDPRKVTYRQKAPQVALRDRDTGRLRAVASVEAEVEVEFCPLRWVVGGAELAGRHERFQNFYKGVATVFQVLEGRTLFGTLLDKVGVAAPLKAPALWWQCPTRAEREIIDAAWGLTGADRAIEAGWMQDGRG